MRLLLDSHVALWWLEDSDRLGPRCRELITGADDAYVSVVTPWELGIKRALGKLTMPDGLVAALRAAGFVPLAISADHAGGAAAPTPPPGPFDRMLVAQAQLESLALVTADEALDPYEVQLVDARR